MARIWGKNLSFYESIYLIDLIYLIPTGKESACQAGDTSSIPGSGGSPGEENGKPFQYSCLGNPMDRGAWKATVHGVAKKGGHDLVTESL